MSGAPEEPKEPLTAEAIKESTGAAVSRMRKKLEEIEHASHLMAEAFEQNNKSRFLFFFNAYASGMLALETAAYEAREETMMMLYLRSAGGF